MKKLFSISFLFIFIISCQSQATITPTTINLTNTPESTSTPTQSPTLIPTATQTLSVEFPDWVKNPDTQILLVPVGTRDKGYENMVLFNAETGERFDIPFTEKERDYFWMPDGSGFGFLDKNKKQAILFSIKGGSIINIPVPKESIAFLDKSLKSSDSIKITTSNFESLNLIFLYTWEILSPDKKYFVYQGDYDNTYTSIFDISKNEIIHVSDPNDEYFDLFSQFSPDSKFLAISQVDQPYDMYQFKTLPIIRLRIYDINSQQIVASYKNVTFPKWSPDGIKFLFQEWLKSGSDFYSYWNSPPCIYDTLNGTTNCYYEIITDNDTQFSSVNWSPDQSMISYVISYKGFCTINLFEKAQSCILENLDTEDQNVISYTWSYDSNFISFIYDTTGAYSDYFDNPKLGIANFQTGEYFTIGEIVNVFDEGLWRPSPNP